MTGPSSAHDAAYVLSQFIYGDAPLDEWVAQGDVDPGEPWISFEQARRLVHAGQQREAVEIWLQITSTEGLESRQLLQAWNFLRQAGCPPQADQAKLVLGVVAQMPVQGSHDLVGAENCVT